MPEAAGNTALPQQPDNAPPLLPTGEPEICQTQGAIESGKCGETSLVGNSAFGTRICSSTPTSRKASAARGLARVHVEKSGVVEAIDIEARRKARSGELGNRVSEGGRKVFNVRSDYPQSERTLESDSASAGTSSQAVAVHPTAIGVVPDMREQGAFPDYICSSASPDFAPHPHQDVHSTPHPGTITCHRQGTQPHNIATTTHSTQHSSSTSTTTQHVRMSREKRLREVSTHANFK